MYRYSNRSKPFIYTVKKLKKNKNKKTLATGVDSFGPNSWFNLCAKISRDDELITINDLINTYSATCVYTHSDDSGIKNTHPLFTERKASIHWCVQCCWQQVCLFVSQEHAAASCVHTADAKFCRRAVSIVLPWVFRCTVVSRIFNELYKSDVQHGRKESNDCTIAMARFVLSAAVGRFLFFYLL